MAISDQNVITHGLKGKIGDLLVFRKQNGKTVVSKMPVKSSVPPTALQTEVNERFRLASKFAKQVLHDPVLLAKYQEIARKGQRPFNAAFSDFFSKPELGNASGTYDGQINALLGIDATEKFELQAVRLKIVDTNGTLVEEGDAEMQMNGITFLYTCTVVNANSAGSRLIWTATDWAGNETVLEV